MFESYVTTALFILDAGKTINNTIDRISMDGYIVHTYYSRDASGWAM